MTEAIEEFDRFLGDPRTAEGIISHERSLADDGRSQFPRDAVEALQSWDLQRYYIPSAVGGGLVDLQVPFQLVRHVARRDLTVAVAHGKTFLGAVSAWVAGGESAERMASIVASGSPVSWGLTEQGRGSDIGSSTTAASRTEQLRLTGAKWPIGNATRGRAMSVLARTEDREGPRSLSLLFVDKERVDRRTISYRPKLKTHGIRGADISGIEFSQTPVDRHDRIGEAGAGLELVLKSLQLTRTMCAALSLGAAEQGLTIAYDAIGRTNATGPTAEARRGVWGDALTRMLFAEAVAFAGIRDVHVVPEEMALESAFVKYLVPDAVDELFRRLGGLLGASSQFVEYGPTARFQKASRDNRVVGIFDGNSVVNLNVVINEFPNIARRAEPVGEPSVAGLRYVGEPPEFAPQSLRLITKRGSTLLRSLPTLVDRLDDGSFDPRALVDARSIVSAWGRTLDDVRLASRASRPPAEQFVLAERVALVYGAAACIGVFLANRDEQMTAVWARGLWLRAALSLVARRLGVGGGDHGVGAELFDVVSHCGSPQKSMTVFPGWQGVEFVDG
jgi:alkylation response protein AidB-like acyl-CoA dehydrogenase